MPFISAASLTDFGIACFSSRPSDSLSSEKFLCAALSRRLDGNDVELRGDSEALFVFPFDPRKFAAYVKSIEGALW